MKRNPSSEDAGCLDHTPIRIKSRLFVLTSALGLSLVSCGRSDRDADLVGAWQITTGRTTQTYTFSQDHTFTILTASAKDLRLFGDWRIDDSQLVITIRSNSFAPPVTHRESARIARLTQSLLILSDQDQNGEPRNRTFLKLK